MPKVIAVGFAVVLSLGCFAFSQGDAFSAECPRLFRDQLGLKIMEEIGYGSLTSAWCVIGADPAADADGFFFAATLREPVDVESGRDLLNWLYTGRIEIVRSSAESAGEWQIQGTPSWGGRADLAASVSDDGTWQLMLTENKHAW